MIEYNKLLSSRANSLKPSGIRRFFDLADSMKDCISLGVGEPDFKTPWHVRQKGIETLQKGNTRYTANAGLLELRKEISAYMNKRFHVEYDPQNQIIVTVGGSEGIDIILRSLINDGDEILIPEPSFVCYRPLAALAGGVPVVLPTYEKDSFVLKPEILKSAITPRTKILILPFPNNPTGALMNKNEYEEIAKVLENTDIIVISDEIYVELNYTDDEPISFAEIGNMYERTIVVNGFSKSYAMTGWRMGYVCGPKEIIKTALKIHQYGIMSAPSVSQYAAVDALKNGDDDIKYMKEHYNMRRLFLLEKLREMGTGCFEPLGAFYVFPNISKSGLNSEEFCEKFLLDKKVAVVPGTAFGDNGEGFVRISYAYSMEHLKKAMELLNEFLTGLSI